MTDWRKVEERRLKRYTYWRDKRKPSLRRKMMLVWLRARYRDARSERIKSEQPMTVSDKGVKFITDFEGFSSTWYDDGRGNATIGYGFLKDEWSKPTITRAEAQVVLRRLLNGRYGAAVQDAAKRAGWRLTQNQYDAAVSWTYNLGTGWVGSTSSFRSLWNAFKARDAKRVANVLPLYRNPGTNVEAGLLRRRNAEAVLFLR